MGLGRRPQGLSLVEVLVTCAILSLLGTVVLLTLQAGWGAHYKQEAYTDAYRAVMLTLENVRSSLKAVEVLTPVAGAPAQSAISFRYCVLDGPDLRVDAEGKPLWSGVATLSMDSSGRLVRDNQDGTTPRVQGHLGQGKVTFQRTGTNLLEVVVQADLPDPGGDSRKSSRYQARSSFYLPNQL